MMHHHQPFAVLSLVLLSWALLVTSTPTCYGGDQNHTAQSALYTPCNQNTPFSMCLRSQVDSGGDPTDTRCLPNGLAQSPDEGGQFWREGCTDPTWNSPYCLHAFDACPNDGNGNAVVTPCSGDGNSSTWCCGGENTACCGTTAAITIAATLGVSSTSSSTSLPTQSPSSTTVPTTSSTASSSVSPTSTSGGTALSVGAEAGIGVGASLAGLAILGCIIWYVLRARRRRTALLNRSELETDTRTDWGGGEEAVAKESRTRYELDGGNGGDISYRVAVWLRVR